MQSIGRRASGLLRLAWPALGLCACPQLLDDDFGLLRDLQIHQAPDGPLDAGSGSGGSAGDTSGAGAGGVTTPDAGHSRDAGSAEGELPDAAAPDDVTPDEDAGVDDPVATLLGSSMVHRYRFNAGATLVDSVGGANATSVGATFADGAAVLAGAGQYLDLPNDLLLGSTNTTIEAWVVWTVSNPAASSAEWQRVFDFGSNSSTVEGQQGSNANAFFLTPKAGTNGKLHVEYESSGNINLEGPEPLATQLQVQLVVVVDEDAQLLAMYRDGVLEGARAFSGSLTTITYRNNWLGRSQYADNPSFQGRILDFRIYSAALASTHIQASFAAGPDADW